MQSHTVAAQLQATPRGGLRGQAGAQSGARHFLTPVAGEGSGWSAGTAKPGGGGRELGKLTALPQSRRGARSAPAHSTKGEKGEVVGGEREQATQVARGMPWQCYCTRLAAEATRSRSMGS